MIQEIIDNINKVITRGTLILYKNELNNKCIKSLHEIIYQVYLKIDNMDKPIMILSLSRTKNLL